ncbi:MAG TPA: PqqD family protein [Candidatus Dormibacteraeota bacterium]|jgi:hypothetical protein|nr:PqqD family protein [Candidatus Dormibacteraeota bacterium]
MKERQFPKARLDCLTRQFEDEILIFDPIRQEGHCLNSTAAAVWKLCDGKSNPSQIAQTLSRQLSVRVDRQVVELALEQLAHAHVLEGPEVSVKEYSRRTAIRRIGIAAAIALPLVTSIVAPMPAHAASCAHNNQPCTDNAQCCSGVCVPVVNRCLGG